MQPWYWNGINVPWILATDVSVELPLISGRSMAAVLSSKCIIEHFEWDSKHVCLRDRWSLRSLKVAWDQNSWLHHEIWRAQADPCFYFLSLASLLPPSPWHLVPRSQGLQNGRDSSAARRGNGNASIAAKVRKSLSCILPYSHPRWAF